MRARVGDLAIARFDPDDADIKAGRKWCEKVCIVIGTEKYGTNGPRYGTFIWWEQGTRTDDIITDSLPPNRLVRARPISDDWEGTLFSLTPDKVVPVVKLHKKSQGVSL